MSKVNEIPYIIHYCWFGGKPLSILSERCIGSWHKFFPDYKFICWDESNFDTHINNYVHDAYVSGKYAFVSDFVRYWALYKYGGLYFDTDVEVIKRFDNIISAGPFMGCENIIDNSMTELKIAPGLGMGAYRGMPFYREMVELYQNLNFNKDNIKEHNVVSFTTEALLRKGLVNINKIQSVAGINIYPADYFSPKDYETGVIKIGANTVSIHHFAASWMPKREFLRLKIKRLIGPYLSACIAKALRSIGIKY